jgi:PAS domain S-box-containing protein
MALADLEHGVPIGFEIWITLGNLAETVVAALGISRLLKGAPHLCSLKTLAKYIVFAVILVPFGSSLLGALGSPLVYGLQERIWFLADALAFLTVTPAILSWVRDGREWARKSHNYLEFTALMASLVLFGYLTFMGTSRGVRPALLYSLVPLLLWAALRLGLKGVSTSMVVVALLSIWGAARGRGPFSEQGALNNSLSLQLFLFFAAIPFTVLAVVVEEQKRAQQALIDEHALLTEAQRLAQMGSWQWDPHTGTVTWSRELYRIAGLDPNVPPPSYKEFPKFYTAESWERLQRAVEEALRTGTPYELDLEIVRPDATKKWIRTRGEAHRDTAGRVIALRGTAQDITERKLSETELAQAHDRLRLAMESGKSVGWDRDVKSGRDSLFGDLQSIFGIPSQVCDGRVEDFYRYVHPEDRRWVVEAVDYAMETHKPYAAEFRLRWTDGTVRWLAAKGKFYYSWDGEPERMLGLAIDITDRKLAEEALRESEERYRLAMQAGRMYAFDWDVITDVIVRSEESTRIFGLTAEPIRLTKRELLTRVYPEDRGTFINSLDECTPENPNTQISYRLLRPDGSVLWLERTGHAFFDEQGRMVRMIGMVADITERKLAEDKLQEYERAVEGLEEMIVVVDREYRYLIANNKFVKMRNMTKEQVVGRFVHEVLTKGVFEAVVKEKLDECFQDKVVRYDMKYTYPELGERDILVSYFPIEGVTGVDRVACIAQDITERKLAEEALSTVSQKLIEAQEKERTRIAMELHDDVGQRLSLLAVHLDRLKQNRPTSAAELGLQVEEVRKQIEDLASDVQALSHQLHSPKLDYLGLAAAAASFCRELSDRHGVEIDFRSENIRQGLPREISLSLFRVLQEALQNAIKHSGSPQLQVSLKGGANEIELTVHDSGVGFEPGEAIKGRGLGLTSMQQRLKLVDGKLSIESKPERGTTIQARVPLSQGHSMGAAG